jgi:hypothetical protein
LEKHVFQQWRQLCRDRLAGLSPVRIVIGIACIVTLVGIPFGIILLIKGLVPRVPVLVGAELKQLAKGQVVWAYPLMVNRLLRQPANREPVPGLFLITLDPEAGDDLEIMGEIALRVGEPPADLSAEDQAFCHNLFMDEAYQRQRRRLLPPEVSFGLEVWAVDLAVHPAYLPGGHLSDEFPLIPCLATPGRFGVTRVMPYWMVANLPPPPWAGTVPAFMA